MKVFRKVESDGEVLSFRYVPEIHIYSSYVLITAHRSRLFLPTPQPRRHTLHLSRRRRYNDAGTSLQPLFILSHLTCLQRFRNFTRQSASSSNSTTNPFGPSFNQRQPPTIPPTANHTTTVQSLLQALTNITQILAGTDNPILSHLGETSGVGCTVVVDFKLRDGLLILCCV